jgi:hypothetical protein
MPPLCDGKLNYGFFGASFVNRFGDEANLRILIAAACHERD